MIQESESQSKLVSHKRPIWQYVLFCAFLVAVGFVIGILIGWAATKDKKVTAVAKEELNSKYQTSSAVSDNDLSKSIHDEITTANLRSNLEFLSAQPHNAGTAGDERLANWIKGQWKDQNMEVKEYWYNLMLSMPDLNSPNLVTLTDSSGNVRFTSQTKERAVLPGIDITKMIPPFNAYSPSGDVEADLVYANYGTEEDFGVLTSNYSIDLTGKIVIIRYGKIFRGNKVKFATDNGAIGVILYSDPADIAPFPDQPVYPDSWWLPGTGVQRGTILMGSGDPQTPLYPSIESAYRVPEDQIDFPKIPCHAIGYDDATQLLSRLQGPTAPQGWAGTIPGITYRLGPGLNETNWKVNLHVSTKNVMVNTSNVIGFIKGAEEPDRYVLIGNHRDAWGFGAIDASSGTTVLMELSRVFSKMANEGMPPRRTLVFCSWGAEEYGIIGSYEWVENFVNILQQRAVAYINVDIGVMGNGSIKVGALPLLHDVIKTAAQQVRTPNAGQTIYDEMVKHNPRKSPSGEVLQEPDIGMLGSGSDYYPFVSFAGIPSIDLSYWWDTESMPISFYPLYHTVYETFHAYEKYLDPDFKYSQTITRFIAEITRQFTSNSLLPYNAMTFGKEVQGYTEAIDTKYGALLMRHNISLDMMKEAVKEFKEATTDFENKRSSIDLNNVWAVRAYNDQLMQLERAFIIPAGLPDREGTRHSVFAPSSKDAYSGTAFPGIVDLLFEIEKSDNSRQRWEAVKRHLAEVIYRVKVATSIVAPYTDF